ncbi:MAG: Hsp20/alpha crystallin family protein [Candidatus Scalinduaceae bacterium]
MAFLSDELTRKMMAKHSNIEKLFEEFFFMGKNYEITSSTPWQPPTDVYETEKDIIVKMAVSGLKPEDISVLFSDYVLTVSGERSDNSAHQKICFYQVEIRYGYFERKIKVPKNVDANNIRATYEGGFIMIVIPKAEKPITSTISIKITY